MGTVVPILGPRGVAVTPYDDFALARRAMLRAYAAWLNDGADPLIVADEIESTHNAMQQLRLLGVSNG